MKNKYNVTVTLTLEEFDNILTVLGRHKSADGPDTYDIYCILHNERKLIAKDIEAAEAFEKSAEASAKALNDLFRELLGGK